MIFLVVLVVAVVVIALVMRAAASPGGGGLRSARPPRGPRPQRPTRPLAPDDDPEFLRDLERRAPRDDGTPAKQRPGRRGSPEDGRLFGPVRRLTTSRRAARGTGSSSGRRARPGRPLPGVTRPGLGSTGRLLTPAGTLLRPGLPRPADAAVPACRWPGPAGTALVGRPVPGAHARCPGAVGQGGGDQRVHRRVVLRRVPTHVDLPRRRHLAPSWLHWSTRPGHPSPTRRAGLTRPRRSCAGRWTPG